MKMKLLKICYKIDANLFHCMGAKRYCSVCESKVRYFLPLAQQYRQTILIDGVGVEGYQKSETLNIEDYLCPSCGASDRERLYALYLKNFLLKKYDSNNISVVHFAPETALKSFLNQMAFKEYRTADLMMKGVNDKVDLTNMNIYDEGRFDFFICSHMLEHIPDDIAAMKELYRILKKGGEGILMVPIIDGLNHIYEDDSIQSEEERLINFGQEDHVRVYSKEGYLERLKSVGFFVEEYTQKDFFDISFEQVAVSEKSVLYVVRKN